MSGTDRLMSAHFLFLSDHRFSLCLTLLYHLYLYSLILSWYQSLTNSCRNPFSHQPHVEMLALEYVIRYQALISLSALSKYTLASECKECRTTCALIDETLQTHLNKKHIDNLVRILGKSRVR